MPTYEYKVVPAPTKAGKIKGIKGTDNRFAAELAGLMNKYGADGWEYQRTDTLPCEERQGLTGRVTTFQNMLIFRRKTETEAAETTPAEAPERSLAMPAFGATAAPAAAPALSATPDAPEGQPPQLGAARPGIAAQ